MAGFTNHIIEKLLLPYRSAMAKDYERYRNHVYRVYLNCLLIDDKEDNKEKYAIAAVFHDMGIWTHHTADYLLPSVELARAYLLANGRWDLAEEITEMILWHHKITAYTGKYKHTVETFRKADWIDVSLGLLSFNASRKDTARYRKLLPNQGFHFMLLKIILRNWLRHPAHPLPMFRK